MTEVGWVGGFLTIAGMILFIAGLQWVGYQNAWTSAHVLVPLLLGAFFLASFCVWEVYGAKYPMFPSRLNQEPKILVLTLMITFISGANFFSVIMFWPTQAYNVYGHDPVGVGVRSIPIGFSILDGTCVVLWLLSVFRCGNKELMIASSILMTDGSGCLTVGTPYDLHQMWGLLVLAGLGIGGIVVPASIMSTIICPDDLIATSATIAALTFSIRVIGGSLDYTAYYNVFISKFVPSAKYYIGGVMAKELYITNVTYITQAVELTGAALLEGIQEIPSIAGNDTAHLIVVKASRVAYAESYKYVYLASIACGEVSIIAACFLGNIDKYMDDHVAVVMH